MEKIYFLHNLKYILTYHKYIFSNSLHPNSNKKKCWYFYLCFEIDRLHRNAKSVSVIYDKF